MKTSTLLLGALAGVGTLAQSAPSTTDGTLFKINGETKYFAGSNSYWISMLRNDADVDLTMGHFADSGLKVLRIWGFNDVNAERDDVWFHLVSASGSRVNEGANGLPRLDAVVAAAERHGVQLIINFVNFWDDYGGISAYVKAFGGTKQSWYTNAAAQAEYKSYIETVVNRFKGSDAIFAWELANEPRCQGCDTSVIYDWAKSTSEYVKSLDPAHMVTLGDEGMGIAGGSSYPFQFGEGTDFAKNLEIETLDFGTFHMYPDSWGVDKTNFPIEWIKAHAAACVAAGKPCLFEEYGTPTNHCAVEGPWQEAMRTTEGIAGDQFWQWGDELSTGRTHDDTNTIYYGGDEWKCLVVDHVAAIE
ncbi:probable Probable mannan endo-1,4-beta-mannosidase A [Cephalotrichum gorgonifer]|uniref:Mannan endo-1,4-beta-mannosidase A n=1 Tax=Cephalotrichum gorgonifer TaxID=2041049 RepID=A0AAE8N5W9_9PEZI|nr:probable Probable mannan endo-1,4-beta-mannosidase A [Cephalotrichum gorgonifer]